MRILFCIMIFLFLSPVCAFAQSAEAEDANKDKYDNDLILNSVVAIFSSSDRSRAFDSLRKKRASVVRLINQEESRIRDLIQENSKIEEEIGNAGLNSAYDMGNFLTPIDKLNNSKNSLEERRQLASLKDKLVYEEARLNERIKNLKTRVSKVPPENTLELRDIESEIASQEENLKMLPLEYDIRIKDLEREIIDIEKSETEQKTLNESRRAEIEKAREDYRSDLSSKRLKISENLEKISKSRVNIFGLNEQIENIDRDIVSLIEVGDADSWFKIIISFTFALLVAIIIFGFFRTTGSNPDIVKSIFSNDSGIQFITLFSIVIAVILFGIIGVLEGKELSALLGGLSGYILGRGAASSRQTGNDAQASPQGQAKPG